MRILLNGALAVAFGFCFGCMSNPATKPASGMTLKKEARHVYDMAGVVVKIENHPVGQLPSGGTNNITYQVDYELDGDKGSEPKKYTIHLNTAQKGGPRFNIGSNVEITGWLSSEADKYDMTGTVVKIEDHPVKDPSTGRPAVTYHVECKNKEWGLPGTGDKDSEPEKYIMPITYYTSKQDFKVGDMLWITCRISEPPPVIPQPPVVMQPKTNDDCLFPNLIPEALQPSHFR